MPYVSTNYTNNPVAPAGKWTCAPGSELGPFEDVPTGAKTKGPDFCGQCVSYVKRVCPTLPATGAWKRGAPVKDNTKLLPGTVIATFDASGKYEGHAAIYEFQSPAGINVYDQYIYGKAPKSVGPRLLRWGAPLDVNNGDKYYVVE